MPRRGPLYQWADRVATHFPDQPRPTAVVLTLWAFGLVLAHACGRTAVAVHLARRLGCPVHTVRRRLRESYEPAARKAGRHRAELDPAACGGRLVRWATAGWAERRVVLAPDVANFADRSHVPARAICYRGCASPVARAVLPGGRPGEWHPHWVAVLRRLTGALGPDWQVVALTGRGLESPRPVRDIAGHGWHPLVRGKAGGKFRPAGWHRRPAVEATQTRHHSRRPGSASPESHMPASITSTSGGASATGIPPTVPG